ncbi:Dehydrodolichyl diphosphate synthase complex subunit DHDDS [Nymphon striatum]|nr:Dehydrodolichyl diphosphate synthase complex subunit DHDDS [Nymphon striatum]
MLCTLFNDLCFYSFRENMSWIRESKRSFLESICVNILKAGEIPRHVAFIMDGNRRYAGRKSMEKIQGHIHGFEKLAECLEWCQNLGIKEVTVYAFSIENFKRSKQEVEDLMDLTREKFKLLLNEKDKLKKHEVFVRILGDLSLLPIDIQKLLAQVMYETQNYDRAVLNICLSYTSREEILSAVKEMMEGVQEKIINRNDISELMLDRCLYTAQHQTLEINPVDLLIRTSGEVRLSDFLLWQSGYAVLSFQEVLWPEFSIWNLFAAVFHYQRNCSVPKAKLQVHKLNIEAILKKSDERQIMKDSNKSANEITLDDLNKYKTKREERINKFLCRLSMKRQNKLNDLIEGQTEQRKVECNL